MFFGKEESCEQVERSADRRKMSPDQEGEQHDQNERPVAEIDIMIAGKN